MTSGDAPLPRRRRRARLDPLDLLPPLDPAGLREGRRAMRPVAIAIAVWGVVTGVAMVNAGLGVWPSVLMTLLVYAGSAQLATLPLLVLGTPLPVVWVTAALVNLRFVIFAAAARRSFVGLPFRQRVVAGYFNGDLGFALFSQRFPDRADEGTPFQHGYFYGCNSMNWLVWEVASMAGIFIGDLAPTEWGLELAAVTALVAVLVPMLVKAPALAGAAVTGACALLTLRLPMRLGLPISVLVGVAVALGAERVVGRGRHDTGGATGTGGTEVLA
ncbi:MAG: AzlC family ABC transporter permease [Ilumatobacteraceae bacterium]